MLRLLGLIAGSLALLSTLAWGAFDYEWWAPLGHGNMGRAFVLWVAHVICLWAGAAALGNK